jgi:hypothetical protein
MSIILNDRFTGISEPEVKTYIDAVEAADGELIEFGVANAVNDFVRGCKNDGIWDAIKACCILAGARTLTGALRPLKGAAPTNNNFVSGDYNRTTGLVGDGSTKYLDSNRNNNAEPQNSKHISAYSVNILDTQNVKLLAGSDVSGATTGVTQLVANGASDTFVGRVNGTQPVVTSAIYGQSLLVAANRSSSSTIELLVNGTLTTGASTSEVPNNFNIRLFGFSGLYFNNRLSFYSIGTSLDLTKLDTRVTTLMNTFSSVIPS